MESSTTTIDISRPVAQRRSSIRTSSEIADRTTVERSSRIEIESSPRNHSTNTKHIKLVVRGGANKGEENRSQDVNLSTLIEEYQLALNRSDCENSNCHRFKQLSYKISQTLLERINAIKYELKVAKTNNNNNNTIVPKASIKELDDTNLSNNDSLVARQKARIEELEKLVEDQRKLRLQDATQVEEKAARIKEWVANKLRELENQNKQLRDQNRKNKDTVESLRVQLASIGPLSSPMRTKSNLDSVHYIDRSSSNGSPISKRPPRSNGSGRESPIYDSVTLENSFRQRKENETKEVPPPPPLHQNDKWESELYNLAELTFTPLMKNLGQDSWQDENDCLDSLDNNSNCRKSCSSIRNELIALVKPSFTTIYGDQVIEGLDCDSSSQQSNMDRLDDDNLSRRASSDHQSQTSSLSDKQRKNSIDCTEDVPPTPIRRLFDSPMRSRSGQDCILRTQSVRKSPAPEKLHDFLVADLIKRGYLVKPGALKSHNRWFVLKNFHLYSYKSETEEVSKATPLTKMKLDPSCQILPMQQSGESNFPFKIIYPDKTVQLVASSMSVRDDWMRMLTVTVNLSDIDPTSLAKHNASHEGLLSVTRHGSTKRCFAILINHVVFFLKSLTDPSPISYLSVKNSRIREITDSSDYDAEDESLMKQKGISQDCSLAIYPRFSTSPDPVYITLGSRNETDKWFYHLSKASGLDQSYGTQFERTVTKLMINNSLASVKNSTLNKAELQDSSPMCIWRDNPIMTYTDRPLSSSLTTLPNETLRSEAIELFKSILLFSQVPLEPIAIDYHVSLLQNCLDRFMKNSELRNEFYAQLIKQSTYIVHDVDKSAVYEEGFGTSENQVHCNKEMCTLLTRLDTLKSNEYPSNRATMISQATVSSKGDDKMDREVEHTPVPTRSALLQVMQIFAVAVSLNLPRGRMRWWLIDHLRKFANPETEIGKYALYTLRAIDRSSANGTRENVPSRTEIMGILLRNPYNHSTPHSIPVSFADGSYLVVETDGSTTVDEFMTSIGKVSDIRSSSMSDFFLFADDPSDSKEVHILEPQRKILDIVGWWEHSFRRYNSGRFESTKVIKLSCKKRLIFRAEEGETYREKLLIVHQVNQEIVSQHVPLNHELAIELAAIMIQLTHGDLEKSRDKKLVERILEKARTSYLPKHFSQDTVTLLTDRWQRLADRSPQDCVRVYLNCFRRIKFNE